MSSQALQLLCVFCCFLGVMSTWLSRDVAKGIVDEFEAEEAKRAKISYTGPDRRTSAPFITGDGFREHCFPNICDETNQCKMDPLAVSNGTCVFVKSEMLENFVLNIAPKIPGQYVIVAHNSDQSTPDGQVDANISGMQKFVTSDFLMREYQQGRLLAHHGQNLWWKSSLQGQPRPVYSHCLPIGIENRYNRIGKDPLVYVNLLRQKLVSNESSVLISEKQRSERPLLLAAFNPRSAPDRHKVLQTIGIIHADGKPKKMPQRHYVNYTSLTHEEWLDAIYHHRFVLAPFGHGLDTHRISEIYGNGGIPVMRRSTISSCYDDSDNDMGKGEKRGSLPLVIVDKWEDLTEEFLEKEWQRIVKIPIEAWDYHRVLLSHWTDRIKNVRSS